MSNVLIPDLTLVTNIGANDVFVIDGLSGTRAIAWSSLLTAVEAAIVGGAPAQLDTLNEIAAALNDDANLAATLTSAIGAKASTSDITAAITALLSGTVTINSTFAMIINAGAGQNPYMRWQVNTTDVGEMGYGQNAYNANLGLYFGFNGAMQNIMNFDHSTPAVFISANSFKVYPPGSNGGTTPVFEVDAAGGHVYVNGAEVIP